MSARPKFDLGDIRVLAIGLALLLVPVAFFVYTLGSPGARQFSRPDLTRSLAPRATGFNVGQQQSAQGALPSSAGGKAGAARATTVSEEFDRAYFSAARTPAAPPVTADMSVEERQMVEADCHPILGCGRAALECGDLSEAEKAFEEALRAAQGNPFLEAYALAGLSEVYSSRGDKKKYEETFKLYAMAVGRLPAGFGGPLMAHLQDASRVMRQFAAHADPAKLGMALANMGPGSGIPAGMSPEKVREGIQGALGGPFSFDDTAVGGGRP